MHNTIENLINKALEELGIDKPKKFNIEHPANLEFGDYSTNIGIITGKTDEIAQHLETGFPSKEIERVEVKAGFINFYLSKEFFANSLEGIIEAGEKFGQSDRLKSEKVIVEYTDPNPFKEFHIGHLMSNAIGESVSRIFEWNGAEVKRVCYQGDVGLHVAKAIFGMENDITWHLPRIDENISIPDSEIVRSLGKWYAEGSAAYESSDSAKETIHKINKDMYSGFPNNPEAKSRYKYGKELSLKYFESIYKKLGTFHNKKENKAFDFYIMESEAAPVGEKIVQDNMGKVFEESDPVESKGDHGAGRAIIFRGEKHDPKLHTRVFINSEGIPTYEAKDLGNAVLKSELYPYTQSVVITGNEIKEYFKVMHKALELTYPALAEKTRHLPHGMLRLPRGKMSSRTGDVITAEELIERVKETILKKDQEATDDIAVGAIKYTILKQGIGNDIVFDLEKSVSTEGDSGPYLQYAYARTNSLLEKAGQDPSQTSPWQGRGELSLPEKGELEGVRTIERLLYRFPEVVERAGEEYAPQHITTYLTELSSAFNNFYAHEQIISNEPEAPYRLAIVKAFNIVMKNGLNVLGIPTPERM